MEERYKKKFYEKMLKYTGKEPATIRFTSIKTYDRNSGHFITNDNTLIYGYLTY